MQPSDLETYLLCNGFDSRIAPEVWKILKEERWVDLLEQSCSRLALPNDSVRMDIRIAAEDVTRHRQRISSSCGISLDEVPYRVQWA